jgi:uncharacterized membrane protein YdjX (TVP38/TMEM64 family)
MEMQIREEWYGIVIFFAVFMMRPFTLVPAFVFAALGGRIFGLIPGFFLGLIASTASVTLPYYAGRLFAGKLEPQETGGKVHQLWRRIAEFIELNPFESILALRLLGGLFYDVVSFTAGYLRVSAREMFASTALGNIPITYAFVALGASLEDHISDGKIEVNLQLVASSVIVFAASLLIARYLREHQRRSNFENKFDTKPSLRGVSDKTPVFDQ